MTSSSYIDMITLSYPTEMRPQWFRTDQIPFSQMWPDDHFWFPMLLNNEKFEGYFKFEGHNKILDYSITKL